MTRKWFHHYILVGIFVFISTYAFADDQKIMAACPGGSWGCTDDWQLSFSVPAVKLRQGEQAQLFEGLAVGLQLNNLFSRTETSLLNAIIITQAFMLSTSTTIDATTSNKKSDYVLSGAILFGVRQGNKSFQIGYGYDVVSSESADVLNSRNRSTILFNIGTGF